jgi:hypothetical protein
MTFKSFRAIPDDAKKFIIEIYDAQDSESTGGRDYEIDDMNLTDRSEFEDDDKILYTKIGKTEIPIDKVLSNLLVVEEYVCLRNIIMQENEDELFSDEDDVFSSTSVRN